jgi:hypothetical protein
MAQRTRIDWLTQQLAGMSHECAEWPYGKNSANYGQVIFHDGRQILVTHAALILSGLGRPPAPGDCALHSCDNPPCFNPRHLRWGTRSENAIEMVDRGRSPLGEARANHKLIEGDIAEIRQLSSQGESQRVIAARFGISQSVVSDIVHFKMWRHVA